LIARRYERASVIVTSNKLFSGWGEIFGDDIVATAMIDGLVHHAEILALKGRELPPQRPRPGPDAGRDLTPPTAARRRRCCASAYGFGLRSTAARATELSDERRSVRHAHPAA
jgi:hypothetical protein